VATDLPPQTTAVPCILLCRVHPSVDASGIHHELRFLNHNKVTMAQKDAAVKQTRRRLVSMVVKVQKQGLAEAPTLPQDNYNHASWLHSTCPDLVRHISQYEVIKWTLRTYKGPVPLS
jgi:hypothetical protein